MTTAATLGPGLAPRGDFPLSRYPRYASVGRADGSAPRGAEASTLSIRVGEALLLWLITRVGVYFTDRVEELESEPMLRRRVAMGILERGVCRVGDRDVA